MKIRFFFFSRSDSGFTYGLPNERETPQISASKIKNQSSPKNRNPQEPQATDSTSEDVQHHDPNQTILQELHKPKKEKHRRNSYWFLETTDVRCRKEAALLRSLRQREREREREEEQKGNRSRISRVLISPSKEFAGPLFPVFSFSRDLSLSLSFPLSLCSFVLRKSVLRFSSFFTFASQVLGYITVASSPDSCNGIRIREPSIKDDVG